MGDDSIQRFFLESPWLLIPVLVVIEYVLVVIWLRRRTPRSRWAALIGLVLCILLPVVQKLVVTQRERVTLVINSMVDAVSAGDVAALAEYVSPNFNTANTDRAGFIAGVRDTLQRYTVEEPRLRDLQITVDGDRATTQFGIVCRILTPQESVANYPSAWEVVFELNDGEWQMISVEPRPTRLFPYERLQQLISP